MICIQIHDKNISFGGMNMNEECVLRWIYIHVFRYFASQSNGLLGQLLLVVLLVAIMPSSLDVFVTLLLPFKLRLISFLLLPFTVLLLVHIRTCQDRDDFWLPLPFLAVVHLWLAVFVVDCNKRLSDVSMVVSSLPFWAVWLLLLLNEFIER